MVVPETTLLGGLFPAAVRATIAPIDRDALAPLWPDEAAYVAGAVTKRQREFATGRRLARALLRDLGEPATSIPAAADRSPRWPTGIVGSIAHTDAWCAVAVARADELRSLGVDIEPDEPLPEDVLDVVLTDEERRALSAASADAIEQGRLARLLFSAKECGYKCQYPLTGTVLEFTDASVALDLEASRFTITFLRSAGAAFPRGSTLAGRFARGNGLVITAIALRRAGGA